MARVDPALVLGLVEAVVGLFGKKGAKIAKVLGQLPIEQADAFLAAKKRIDAAAAAGETLTLTAEEVAALDFVLDRLRKLARKVKSEIAA